MPEGSGCETRPRLHGTGRPHCYGFRDAKSWRDHSVEKWAEREAPHGCAQFQVACQPTFCAKGGVRSFVIGDIIGGWSQKTMSQQFTAKFKNATKPFQNALSTKLGVKALPRGEKSLTDSNAATTVLSIDGVDFDLISRRAMMEALHRMPDSDVILPFVLHRAKSLLGHTR